jgi:hypothetical protein
LENCLKFIIETSSTCDLIDYLSDAGIFVNLFQLIDYIKTNEITKKVLLSTFSNQYKSFIFQLHGFMSKYPVNKNQLSDGKNNIYFKNFYTRII